MKRSAYLRQTLSLRLDPIAYRFVRTKPNYSKYIENLVIQDMQLQNKEPIYQAIVGRLLKDEEILPVLAKKLSQAGPVVRKVDSETTVIEGDWGA